MKVRLMQLLNEYAAEFTFFLFKIGESMLEPTVRMFIYDGVCLNLYPADNGVHTRHGHHYQYQQGDGYHSSTALVSTVSTPTFFIGPTSTSAGATEHHLGSTCGHLHHYPDRETVVQDEAARYMMFYKILLNFPAIILVLFCGALSDRTGRKLPVLLTCFGTISAVVLYLFSIHVGPGHGAPYLPLFLVGAGVRGAFGRSAVMTMAVHSYVSDRSSAERRTQKISNLVAMSHFGYLIGSSSAGLMLDHFGFAWVFLTVAVIQTACAVAAVICMEEFMTVVTLNTITSESSAVGAAAAAAAPGLENGDIRSDACDSGGNNDVKAAMREGGMRSESQEDSDGEVTPLLKKTAGRSLKSTSPSSISTMGPVDDRVSLSSTKSSRSLQFPLAGDMSDQPQSDDRRELPTASSGGSGNSCLSLFKESFMVLLKPREGTVRCQLIALFVSIYVQQMMKAGEIDVLLLYVERTPMNMTKTTYGYFLAVNYLCLGLNAFVGPWLLERLLHFSDGTIAVIGLFARLGGLVVLCLSDTVWMVFLAAAIGGPHSLTVSSCKSMISKMIGDGDMGKTFSLLSSGETLANLLGTAAFVNLYAATLTFYAGSTFAVEGIVFVVLTVVIACIGNKQRRQSGSKETGTTSSRMYTSP